MFLRDFRCNFITLGASATLGAKLEFAVTLSILPAQYAFLMNDDLAYLLGLIIGGGIAEPRSITIEFPYRQWPHEDFEISAQWFNDCITNIAPIINRELNATANPQYIRGTTPRFYLNITNLPNATWALLNAYGIMPIGQLRRSASIARLLPHMNVSNKKIFVSGLADVIGSVRASHRHRSLESTIVSFEIIGENYSLAFELCQLLHGLGVPVDQILWHHPNMHAGLSRTAYWKKGTKVRVKAGDFEIINFGLECKREGLSRLIEMEERARGYVSHGSLCPGRRYRINGLKVNHAEESSTVLPLALRGHFIHYTHICCALGCPYAPRDWLAEKMRQYGGTRPCL